MFLFMTNTSLSLYMYSQILYSQIYQYIKSICIYLNAFYKVKLQILVLCISHKITKQLLRYLLKWIMFCLHMLHFTKTLGMLGAKVRCCWQIDAFVINFTENSVFDIWLCIFGLNRLANLMINYHIIQHLLINDYFIDQPTSNKYVL